MTQAFIEDSIGSTNLNKWISLHGLFQRISLLSDGIITVDPKYRLFYFDTTCQMMHVLNLTGDIREISSTADTPIGYVRIILNGKHYINKIAPYAIPCDLEGNNDFLHTSISFDKIVGFYKQLNVELSDILK